VERPTGRALYHPYREVVRRGTVTGEEARGDARLLTWRRAGWRKEMTWCHGLDGASRLKLCELSVEDLGQVQRNVGCQWSKEYEFELQILGC
jgi:hypothetical protein